jgi:hypothetical protein
MVVDVEAERPEEAHEIAIEIVKMARPRGYEEVLIYVRPMRSPDGPTRRVQWTPAGGYVESRY